MSISEHKHVLEGEAPAPRVEIFTGEGRRRSWNAREKSAIVAESFEEGVRARHVARRRPDAVAVVRLAPGGAPKAEARIDASPFVPAVAETANTAPNFDAANNAAVARPHSIELDIEGSSVWVVNGHLNSQIDDLLPWAYMKAEPSRPWPENAAHDLSVDRHHGCVSAAALSRRPVAEMGRRIGAGAQLGIEAIG